MKKIFLFMLIFLMPFVVNAYEVKMDWQKSWGGNGDEFLDIFQTQDGGFIAYGYSWSTDIEGLPNNDDSDTIAIIVKYDKDGNILWQNSWDGNNLEQFLDIFQTQDGGFIACGFSSSTDIEGLPNKGYNDAIIVKYDKDGKLLWQKSWGGNSNEQFLDIFQTQDGGFIALSHSSATDIEGLPNKGSADAIIVKFDKDGNMLWQKSWGGNNWDAFNKLLQTEDGGFIACGFLRSTDIEGLPNKGSADAIIVKFDKDGNMLWQKNWGGNKYEEFLDIFQTQDGGFIACGFLESTDIEGLPNKGFYDAIIVKYDKDGKLMWQKSWGGNYDEQFLDIFQTQDGGFVVTGTSSSKDIEGISNKGMDAIIIKYDKDGKMLWQKNFWMSDKDYLTTRFNSIVMDGNGNLILSVDSFFNDEGGKVYEGDEDATIISYDQEGNLLGQKKWVGNKTDIFEKLLYTENNEIIVSGFTRSTDITDLLNKGRRDAIIVKYSFEYDLRNVTTEKGTFTSEQQGAYGVIKTTPNQGYEVDQIIIKDKDGNVVDVELIQIEEGKYSFKLYTDVSVEVTFKEKIENPKTGILDVITILIVGIMISITGFFLVKNYNERYEM